LIVRELATLLNFRVDDRQADRYEQRLNQISATAARAAGVIAAALGAAFGIDKIIEAGDAYTNTMNRLGASTSGPEQASEAFEKLYSSARETGVAVGETSKAFMRFSPAMTRAGYSMDDTIGLIDGIQKGLLAAGSTAAETSSIFLQLGQAVNSGSFAGDELKAFLEGAPPALVARFAEALGTTVDKLKEMGSEGKLTTKNVLPALMAAAKAGRDEFGRLQVTVGLATARSKVAFDRFLAEFERGFGITAKLADLIERAGRKFDEWRRFIPVIRNFVNEFGGLERILGAVVTGLGFVTVGAWALNGALTAVLARVALLAAKFMAVLAVGLLLQDFFIWLSGSDTKTLFGEWFGSVDDLLAPIQPQLEAVKKLFAGTPDEIRAAWDQLKEYFRNWAGEAFANFPPAFRQWLGIGDQRGEAQPPPQDDRSHGDGWRDYQRERFGQVPMGDAIRNWFSDRLGALGFRRQIEQADGTMRPLRPGESMSDAMLSRGLPASGPVTLNQNNTFNNNTTVTATGTSGAEIAGAAERGVSRGTDDIRLGAGQAARDLLMAIPRTEGASTTGGGF
jgi:tape measure domain-containing protein